MIEEILSKIDIFEFLRDSGFKKLKKGKEITALCPFHNDRNPSFSINPNTGFFYCHACHEGGNFIQLYMKLKNMVYHEAMRELANMAGVEFKETGDFLRYRELYRVMDFVASLYHRELLENRNPDAMEILNKKGVDEDTIINWKIGFAPGDDTLIKRCLKEGIDLKTLRDLGLVKQTATTYTDFFRMRIIIPVRDLAGRVIGFGGRSVSDEVPKYLNSMETVLFKKKSALFGIDRALSSIRKTGNITLLEGYFDVIAMHKANYTDSAGMLGTAFSFDAIHSFKNFVENITLLPDPDEAGYEAVLKIIPQALSRGINVSVIVLKTKKDIDEILLEGSDISSVSDKLLWDDFVLSYFSGGFLDQKRMLEYIKHAINNAEDVLKEIYMKRICDKLKLDKLFFSVPVEEKKSKDIKIDDDAFYIAYYIKAKGKIRDIPYSMFNNPESCQIYEAVKNGADIELPLAIKYILARAEEPSELDRIIARINLDIERFIIKKKIDEIKNMAKEDPYVLNTLMELRKEEQALRRIKI